MQRRLTIALLGIALAAVLLVGAGVLVLAQVGARSDTENEVRSQLEAFAELTETGTVGDLRSFDRARTAFRFDDLGLFLLTAEGDLRRLVFEGGPGRRRGARAAPDVFLTLTPDELAAVGAGKTVIVGRDGDRSVTGVLQLTVAGLDTTSGEAIAIVASQPVVTIGSEGRLWFVASAVVVLGGSAVAARVLSRRLVRPIAEIERATAAVASGDFEARVDADGDDELGQLGRSVNRMAGDLARSRALDQQFLMSISHDLRTPLTAIAGYAEALRDGATTDPVHAGEVIGDHAERLDRLVRDLLDLAKLDANRFTLDMQPFDLAVAVGRTVAGLTPRAEQHGLALTFTGDGPIGVTADPLRVAQAVGNVIDNAITFARTQIAVSVASSHGQAVVTVTDDGPGIAAEDLPHVFERLYVAGSQPERAENPTGMGLAIVRELLTAMGGSVTARSEQGQGTTIVLDLPFSPAVTTEASPAG